jgi:alkylated DNA repair protein (DNA oxidative demethylase)
MDLFDLPPVPGFAFRDAVVTPDEERALIVQIDAAGLSPFKFQRWTGKRLTQSFGWRYDFETGDFGPAEPIPDWLLPVRERMAAALTDLPAAAFEQALVIRYDPGAGIGWHRDRPMFEHVLGLSLGAPATLRLRRRTGGTFARTTAPLAPRSGYRLSGEVRHDWEHSIVPMVEPRWSVTFRSFA